MKLGLGLALVGSLLTYAPLAQAQPSWQEVTVNSVGDRFLVDQNSIQSRGNSIWYWEYRDFRQPNNAFVEETIQEPVYGVMLYRSVDCAAGIARARQLIVHTRERKEVQRFNYGDTGYLAEPRPGSSDAAVLDYVCERQQPAPQSEASSES